MVTLKFLVGFKLTPNVTFIDLWFNAGRPNRRVSRDNVTTNPPT
jgi:hypothetical protein